MLGSDKFFRRLGIIIRRYKHSRMLVAIQALNNITSHKLLITYCEMLSDHYRHQTTNNFEKLLEQKDAKNTSKVATSIFLTIGIYIGPNRLLEVGSPNTEYDSEGKLCERCTGVYWDDESEVKEAMTAGNDKNNDDKDPQEKTR